MRKTPKRQENHIISQTEVLCKVYSLLEHKQWTARNKNDTAAKLDNTKHQKNEQISFTHMTHVKNRTM